ncbi:MAG TPA: S8 family serine peptidase [Phycisphaerae bacterium]|nr:S8 family serine peptidase [Phycisphaerae bacterium]HNU46661.1 S8 family serine peptidase [Phycisphaerae bacterium]
MVIQVGIPHGAALAASSRAARNVDTAAQVDEELAQAIDTAVRTEIDRLAGVSYTLRRTYRSVPFAALSVSESALEKLESSPGVVGISEDRLMSVHLDGTVGIVGADDAWALGYGGSAWYVAVLDSGIRASHHFFAGKHLVQACFASGQDGDPANGGDCPNGQATDITSSDAARYHANPPRSDHGTHVAGIVAGNDAGVPRFGIARDADLIVVQVFSQFFSSPDCDPPGTDCVLAWTDDQIAALDYVYSLRTLYPIAAVNMSLGAGVYSNQSQCDQDFAGVGACIDNLRAAGIATVISSGNDGSCIGISAPGCVSTAVAVGAVDDNDAEPNFSNYEADFLELYGPGVDVRSATIGADDSYTDHSGTSMAAPHVSGAWAILKQAAPWAMVETILEILQTTGHDVAGRCTGTPTQHRIQVDAALTQLLSIDPMLVTNTNDTRPGLRFSRFRKIANCSPALRADAA